MTESKTIQTLEKYYDILKNEPTSEDDNFVAHNIEFDLAKSLLQEFGKETSHKIAKMLLANEEGDNGDYRCPVILPSYSSHAEGGSLCYNKKRPFLNTGVSF